MAITVAIPCGTTATITATAERLVLDIYFRQLSRID